MTVAALAKLLIEGPRIVEDVAGPMDPITRTAMGGPGQQSVDNDDDDYPSVATDGDEAQDGAEKTKIDKKIAVYLNRVALRLFSVPSLQTFWKDTVLFSDTGSADGRCKIQLVFHRLPEEAHPMLVKLLAAPRDPKFTRFVDRGQARTGVEVEVGPDDFGGEEFDYAF
jgi:hypothetical protein